MILIVLSRSYMEFRNWARDKFPYTSPADLQRECVCITDERDIDKLGGVRRGQLFVDIGGGTELLRTYCRIRMFHEIRFEAGE